MTWLNRDIAIDNDFWSLTNHSFILAIATAVVATLISLIMAYGQRLYPSLMMRSGIRIAAMGYAIPGSVIAVGILIPLGGFDNALDGFMQSTFNISTGLLLSGTIVSLVFAYLVRFLAVAFSSCLLYTSPSPRDLSTSRMPSSA